MVLPAYNEEANIGPMIEACLEVLPGLAEDFEVIVVDDGSSDATSTVAEDGSSGAIPDVRLLVHDRNQGYGAAIRSGLQHARMGLVFYTDADRQFDVVRARLLPADGRGPRSRDRLPRLPLRHGVRSLVSWAYNRIVAVLFRVRVRDVDCAFKLMRAEVRDKLPLQTDDFFIDTEIVACARKWNFRIGEKGVRHYPRVAGETTVAPSDVADDRTIAACGGASTCRRAQPAARGRGDRAEA